MIKIYADFNNSDELGRVRLNTVGSLEDLDRNRGELTEGLKVTLYTPGEFEVQGVLLFEDGIWRSVPDWETIRYDEPKGP